MCVVLCTLAIQHHHQPPPAPGRHVVCSSVCLSTAEQGQPSPVLWHVGALYCCRFCCVGESLSLLIAPRVPAKKDDTFWAVMALFFDPHSAQFVGFLALWFSLCTHAHKHVQTTDLQRAALAHVVCTCVWHLSQHCCCGAPVAPSLASKHDSATPYCWRVFESLCVCCSLLADGLFHLFLTGSLSWLLFWLLLSSSN